MSMIKRMVSRVVDPLRRLRLYRTPQGRAVLRHRREIIQIAESYGFTNVRVFGSVARGDADSDSDVDLAVDLLFDQVGHQGRHPTLLDKIGSRNRIAEMLDLDVDFITAKSLRDSARPSATREAIKL